MSKKIMYFSSKKAKPKLGYHSRPATEGLKDAIEWFNKEKYEIQFEAVKDSLNKSVGKDRSAPEASSSSTQTAEEFTSSRVADFQKTGDTSRGF